MPTKYYKTVGRYRKIKFFNFPNHVIISRLPTKVDDAGLQKDIETSSSFKRRFVVLCEEEKEQEAPEVIADLEDGRLSYGLNELKEMHITQLRAVAKRASVWQKGMKKEEMIDALMGV